ncbi:ankyrin repeat-containing [Fusarium albosuccineum]|uniref:Ankyrin repeat-containing n=1 Tax=Fusarium albosuccineum TaxID=1237068 RepID=A0A8H4LEN6_9HYPO|nr:ankyrin repeat-containing [Fusarium albosuccineum]
MRLVDTKRIQLAHFDDDKIPKYAILSHKWEQEEVLFQDMQQGTALNKKGYAKLESCCRVARDNGFQYIWDDTCCIDKTSSAELSEAINSMYRYYQEADICYAYLADVSALSELSDSRWFTRGWTLQELIAPHDMIFFDREWNALGTKMSLVEAISHRTGIPAFILCDSEQIETTSIAQRMSWAADRVTTRKEDRAYSLMGIFGINMPLLYGEGEKAFYRLQEEIMRVSEDHSLFAWRHSGEHGGFLAPTPSAFKDSGNIIPWNPFTPYNSPFTLTNKGVHMDAPFIAQDESGRGIVILYCAEAGRRNELIAVHLRDVYLTMEHYERCRTKEFETVDLNHFNFIQYPVRTLCIRLQTRDPRPRDRRSRVAPEAPLGKVYSSLSAAAVAGDEGAVWLLLAQTGALTGASGDDAQSAICLAARGGHERLVSQLMTQRDTSNFLVDRTGRTVLSHAAEFGHEAVVRLILSTARVQPDAKDDLGLTALWYATRNGHKEIVALLLATGVVSANVCGKGESALWHPASRGDFDLVRLLLEHGAVDNEAGQTALCEAASKGYARIVEALLINKASPLEAKGLNEQTAFRQAFTQGHITIMSLLVSYGANIEAKDLENRTPLCYACHKGDEALVEFLLEHGANTEARDVKRQTPLLIACVEGNQSLVEFLLKHGAKTDKLDSVGRTPLARAAMWGNVSMVKLLLENGADPRATCSNGKTAASYAVGKETKNLLTEGRWYRAVLNRTGSK